MRISSILDENIIYFNDAFTDSGDIVKRRFSVAADTVNAVDAFIIYIDAMSDRTMLEYSVIKRLILLKDDIPAYVEKVKEDLFAAFVNQGITTADIKEASEYIEITRAVLSGDAALFFDGYDNAIIISAKGYPNRGVQAAETEVVVQGSKESFSEVMRTNTALIRRRIKDTELKVKQINVGRRSCTDIALVYLNDVVNQDVLKEAESKIRSIDIDAILDSGYIEQLTEENWGSPFPQAQVTERPDKAAAAILEGRIVIIVDNSPFVLIIPATLNTFFQASEDYYQRWLISSFVRVVRYIAGFLSVSLPGLYIALALFHPTMLPTLLIFKMAGARQMVPFPAAVEILIMEFTFELLREAGIRLPGPMGGTMGIVGGLIVGQAAVEAGLVSPIVVIVVAMSGIASFAIPHFTLVTGFRIVKYLNILLSSILGLFGFWAAGLATLVHLAALRSYGIPYLSPFASGDINNYSDVKDSIFRLPLFMMKKRPIFASKSQLMRQGGKVGGWRDVFKKQ